MPESGSFGPSGNPTTAAAAGASCLRGVVKLLALVVVPWCLFSRRSSTRSWRASSWTG